MNVLILPAWYPNKKDYVGGIFIKEQVKALKSVGINPIVYYPFDNEILPNDLRLNIEDTIKVYRANTDYMKNSKLSKFNSFKNSIRDLKKIVKDNSIDLIHAHVGYPAGVIAYLHYLTNKSIPYILTEHRSNTREFAARFYNGILKRVYLNAKSVITVSEFLKKELENLEYVFNGKVIGNVVDIPKEKVVYNPIKEKVTILFIGSMKENEVKGIRYLIPALARFIKNISLKVNVLFIGEGTYKESYENLAQNFGIKDNCTFIGSIPNESVGEYIKRSNFVISSSIKETFGAVLIESMSYGRPVLATKCGGPQEFVNEFNGILVEKESVDELYYGVNKMVKNYSQFSSEDIKKYVEDNYSLNVIGEKLKKEYEVILKSI